MTVSDILIHLQQRSSTKYLAGMSRFGVDSSKAYGVPVPELRKLAKALKKNHNRRWNFGKPASMRRGF